MPLPPILFFFFFFNDTATTEIYTLSLHDALPIYTRGERPHSSADFNTWPYLRFWFQKNGRRYQRRSEEHTSELQSLAYLVCRLLLEKKKTKTKHQPAPHMSRQIQHTKSCASIHLR